MMLITTISLSLASEGRADDGHGAAQVLCVVLRPCDNDGQMLVLSHQSMMGQLFKLGPDDADALARHFEHIKPDDLMRLPPHRALARAGETTIELTMPDVATKRYPASPRRIRDNCRSQYGRPLEVIKAALCAAFLVSLVMGDLGLLWSNRA